VVFYFRAAFDFVFFLNFKVYLSPFTVFKKATVQSPINFISNLDAFFHCFIMIMMMMTLAALIRISSRWSSTLLRPSFNRSFRPTFRQPHNKVDDNI
jgi:hypothetical protein